MTTEHETDPWLHCAQPPWTWEELEKDINLRHEREAAKNGTEKKETSSKRKQKDSMSYVISKAPRKGHRLIKIQVLDYNQRQNANYSESVRVQYTVVDPIDEVMDLTESIVNKICKKLSDSLG